MRVIAYTYDADAHCTVCAQDYSNARGVLTLEEIDDNADYNRDDYDEHGIRYDLTDTEGNTVHPVFSTDDTPIEGLYCGNCHDEILEPVSDGEFEECYL